MSYLDRLSTLNLQEKDTLLSLGVDSPLSLYFLIRTARDQFDIMLGTLRTDQLLKELKTLVPPRELENVKNFECEFNPPPLGALLKTESMALTSSIDLGLRDRLFNELQVLKQINTPEAREQALKVESQLNNLLDCQATKAAGSGS